MNWRDHVILDTDSLLLIDAMETGDPALDLIPKRNADGQNQRNAQYRIEQPAVRTECDRAELVQR